MFCRSIVVSFKLNLFSNTEEHVAVCFFLIPQNEIILLSIERSSNHPKRLDSLCGRLRKPPTVLMHCLEKLISVFDWIDGSPVRVGRA